MTTYYSSIDISHIYNSDTWVMMLANIISCFTVLLALIKTDFRQSNVDE